MYIYKHAITQEIIEIEDIIVDSTVDYFDSSSVAWWYHINDQTNKIDKYSSLYDFDNSARDD